MQCFIACRRASFGRVCNQVGSLSGPSVFKKNLRGLSKQARAVFMDWAAAAETFAEVEASLLQHGLTSSGYCRNKAAMYAFSQRISEMTSTNALQE